MNSALQISCGDLDVAGEFGISTVRLENGDDEEGTRVRCQDKVDRWVCGL